VEEGEETAEGWEREGRTGNAGQVAITVRGRICSEVICRRRERRKSIASAVFARRGRINPRRL